MDELREWRYFIYLKFVNFGQAPIVEEFMENYKMSRNSVKERLKLMQENHMLALVPNSYNILIVNPFSDITTANQVQLINSPKIYYGNCPWDLIGMHFAFNLPLVAKSYCQQTGSPITFTLQDKEIKYANPSTIFMYFTKPFSDWYTDLINT